MRINLKAQTKWLGVALVGAGAVGGCLSGEPTLPELPGTGGSEGPTGGGATSATGAAEATSVADTNAGGTTGEPTSATGADEGSTGPAAVCGNGEVEDGEACDGMDWAGASCETLGFAPGVLDCTDDCGFDVSGCVPEGMVLVPAGEFTMGSNVEPDEQPIRVVYLDAFWIDATEVTVAAYAACLDAGKCADPQGFGGYYNYGAVGREDHPINGIDWIDADAYCVWMGKQLPTEAQWEKAARWTDGRTYPWGNAPEPSCSHVVMSLGMSMSGCGMGSTAAVGSRPMGESPYEALDMMGNVWEWVGDWYGNYDPAATDNPTGPLTPSQHVLRGGSFFAASPQLFRAANRYVGDPSYDVLDTVGFRCAQTPPVVP